MRVAFTTIRSQYVHDTFTIAADTTGSAQAVYTAESGTQQMERIVTAKSSRYRQGCSSRCGASNVRATQGDADGSRHALERSAEIKDA